MQAVGPTIDCRRVQADILCIDPMMPAERVLEIYDVVRFWQQQLKELQQKCEAAMIAYIKATGRDLEVGNGVRYYVGKDKSTKCVDVPAAVTALMDATQGDMERFCSVLAANALKHGAARKVLPPDAYKQYFVETIKEALEEGKATVPVEKLIKADERFM